MQRELDATPMANYRVLFAFACVLALLRDCVSYLHNFGSVAVAFTISVSFR